MDIPLMENPNFTQEEEDLNKPIAMYLSDYWDSIEFDYLDPEKFTKKRIVMDKNPFEETPESKNFQRKVEYAQS